jgi:hypothetical protein
MGKIGDLWVRLGLKSDEYKRGIKDAQKETQGFIGKLSNMKAGALAVWAAIGASVTGFAKQMISATNSVGDKWARFTAQAKAGWDTFLQSLSSMNWNDFIGRFKDATAAAKELQNALDAEFEISNSIRLQKASMAEELAQLEILARDQTKTYKERAEAAQKYLTMVEPLYKQELDLAKKLEDAQLGKWLSGSGISDSEQVRKDLRNFLVAYGKDQNLINSLGIMLDANSRTLTGSTKLAKAQLNGNKEYIAQYRAASQFVADYQKNNGYGTSIYALANIYEKMRGDADTKPLVDAMIAAGEAAGAFNAETRKMQSALNAARAQMSENVTMLDLPTNPTQLKSFVDEIEAFDLGSIMSEMGIEEGMADVENDMKAFLDSWAQDVQSVAQLNQMLSDSFVSAFGNGMQAITDLMMGIEGADMKSVMAAFLAPFADTMKQMGSMIMSEGIAMTAFKKSFSNPAAAIAAGAALIAVGSAVSSGLQRLTANPTGGSAGSTATSSSYGSSELQNYESTLTVEVTGRISGNDIVLSGKKTNDYNAR